MSLGILLPITFKQIGIIGSLHVSYICQTKRYVATCRSRDIFRTPHVRFKVVRRGGLGLDALGIHPIIPHLSLDGILE